ncbi:MAG: Gfo/Idh/MocA family oxidoreductase [Clostridia bacterium]|nr:Gfo/Idh/MocA family oxidoreductase [Clostridia bacterium]
MAFTSAVIGLGGMGTWHVENIQKKVPRIHVKGAYDIRPEALEKTGRLGIQAYGSLDELLGDPEIDLVTIAIPNDMHKDTAIKALRAGKNVVCESPSPSTAPSWRRSSPSRRKQASCSACTRTAAGTRTSTS